MSHCVLSSLCVLSQKLTVNGSIEAVNEGKYGNAVSIFDKILEQDPTYPEALIGRGTSLVFQRELDAAISDFTKVSIHLYKGSVSFAPMIPWRVILVTVEGFLCSKRLSFTVIVVELGSRAGALKLMLLDILEDTHEIRHICIIGKNCVLKKENDEIECSVPLDKEIAEEEEEEEIEMLLENYLQSVKEMKAMKKQIVDLKQQCAANDAKFAKLVKKNMPQVFQDEEDNESNDN
ncbi:hypothetical protein FXO38_23170 [Capsicum annuum]|nr:hypothetical protein FXO38_23170 [Capsicum annuum]KAF3641748.1 hypothetical protein FXO37_22821 [Capsicum annuum]